MSEFWTENPSTLEKLQAYQHASSAEIERALEKLARGHRDPRPRAERIRACERLAKGLRDHADELALLISLEMGKPLADAKAEVEKSATAADFFAKKSPEFFSRHEGLQDKWSVWAAPSGILLAIMPWNFPVWQIMRVLPAALVLGNPVLLKHADLVAGSAQLFGKTVTAAIGDESFAQLFLDHEQVAQLIRDPRIRSVTMTGSSRGGREVAAEAGRALKKVVLELGGSDPYLVFEDADVEKAAALCAETRLVNNGQSCVSGKRFLVHEKIADQFLASFASALAKPKIGSPQDPATKLGPLASRKFQKGISEQVQKLSALGARRVWERSLELPDLLRSGAFFAPQVWEVRGDEPFVQQEEFFGPVALFSRFRDEAEAIRLANGSVYGLGSGVFTQDSGRQKRVARALEAGFVAINDFVRSDARVPFGGVKDSGFGRELGLAGWAEFVSWKTIGGNLEPGEQ